MVCGLQRELALLLPAETVVLVVVIDYSCSFYGPFLQEKDTLFCRLNCSVGPKAITTKISTEAVYCLWIVMVWMVVLSKVVVGVVWSTVGKVLLGCTVILW